MRVSAILIPILLPFPVHAQTVTGSVGAAVAIVPTAPRINSPVSLVETRTTTQTLADGTHIVRTTREMFYRDAQGRTRTATEFHPSGLVHGFTRNISVYDPILGRTITWMESSMPQQMNQYTLRAVARPSLLADAPPPDQTPLLQRSAAVSPALPAQSLRPDTQRQDLGSKDVQGFSCNAERTVTTYPADFFGNDRPIVVTEEHCASQELGRMLQQTREDPRRGSEVLTIETLNRNEPEPSLFQPPSGYTERPQAGRIVSPSQ